MPHQAVREVSVYLDPAEEGFVAATIYTASGRVTAHGATAERAVAFALQAYAELLLRRHPRPAAPPCDTL